MFKKLWDWLFGSRELPEIAPVIPLDDLLPANISFDAFHTNNIDTAFQKNTGLPGYITLDNLRHEITFKCDKDSTTPNKTRKEPAQKSELVGLLDASGKEILETGGIVFFGLKVKFTNWTPIGCTFFQLHKTDSYDTATGPSFALRTDKNNRLLFRTHGGDTKKPVFKEVILSQGVLSNTWQYLIIRIAFDKVSGSVNVFMKDEGTTFREVGTSTGIPTLLSQNGIVIPSEHHIGIYSEVKDFERNIIFGEFKRSSSFNDLVNNMP